LSGITGNPQNNIFVISELPTERELSPTFTDQINRQSAIVLGFDAISVRAVMG
jgi:hypothetical protein